MDFDDDVIRAPFWWVLVLVMIPAILIASAMWLVRKIKGGGN